MRADLKNDRCIRSACTEYFYRDAVEGWDPGLGAWLTRRRAKIVTWLGDPPKPPLDPGTVPRATFSLASSLSLFLYDCYNCYDCCYGHRLTLSIIRCFAIQGIISSSKLVLEPIWSSRGPGTSQFSVLNHFLQSMTSIR